MIPDLRNTKESPGHSPVICRKMAGIVCFLLKIHPRRQCIRCLLLLFLGGVFHLAARIEDQPGGGRFWCKDPVSVLLGDAHHVIRHQRVLGGGVSVVVIVDVNAERNIDGQQNSQQAEEHSEGKRFFLLVLYRTPLFYKHFPQSLQPLQINLLPQVSQFARK